MNAHCRRHVDYLGNCSDCYLIAGLESKLFVANAAYDALLAEKQELEAALADARRMNDQALCVYCGYIGPREITAIAAHMDTCEKHPMKTIVGIAAAYDAVLAEKEALEAEVERLRVEKPYTETEVHAAVASRTDALLAELTSVKQTAAAAQFRLISKSNVNNIPPTQEA